MRTAFIQALYELAEQDSRVWLLCGDIGYSVLEDFSSHFPDRFINAGVAEQNMIGIATGLAMCGKIVFVYSIANFPTLRCLEQIRNDICYHRANIKIVAVGGGFAYGSAGYTHHCLEDLAIMRVLPEMTVVAPGDPVETKLATKAIFNWQGPCYLRLGKAGEPIVYNSEPDFKVGKMILVKNGSDAAVFVTGGMLYTVLEAAQKAESQGCSVAVWSSPWLKPFDVETVMEAGSAYPVIFTVEEAQINAGLGSSVAEILASSPSSCAKLRRLGVADVFLREAYTQNSARVKMNLDASGICQTILGTVTQFKNSHSA